ASAASDAIQYFVVFTVMMGDLPLANVLFTQPSSLPIPDSWLSFDPPLPLSSIPQGAILTVSVYAAIRSRSQPIESRLMAAYQDSPRPRAFFALLKKKYAKHLFPVAWANVPIATIFGTLFSGYREVPCFPGGPANPYLPVLPNRGGDAIVVEIQLPKWDKPVAFPDAFVTFEEIRFHHTAGMMERTIRPRPTPLSGSLSTDTLLPALSALGTDPLYRLDPTEQKMIWELRADCQARFPHALPKVIQSCPWGDPAAVAELHRLLKSWPALTPLRALELLGPNYPNPSIRKFAVLCLTQFSDDELHRVLLQLLQSLKHEHFHSSTLGHFLLLRAQQNPLLIGESLFWYFESELQDPMIRQRFSCFKNAILTIDPALRASLLFQSRLCRSVKEIAFRARALDNAAERVQFTKQQIQTVNEQQCQHLPGGFKLPLDPSLMFSGFVPAECKTLVSFTTPLWLRLQSMAGDISGVIFKVGDDLRQDILTLQLLSLMDLFWKYKGLDLHIISYRVVATAESTGLIEVVPDSMTTSAIQKEYAGGAVGALMEKTLAAWLRKHNPDEHEYLKAVKQFVYSSAGYAVATYVLGIGDRHNDNVMLQKNGNLFHIGTVLFSPDSFSRFLFSHSFDCFVVFAQILGFSWAIFSNLLGWREKQHPLC
ncbi:MAG: hypothetical protein Q8P67_23935, partial [archaeon]|nr:hypothetical protein [archaeon]